MVDYAEHPPPPYLEPWVRCVWTLRGSSVVGAGSPAEPPPDKVVPDGAPELVINCADRYEEIEVDGSPRRQSDLLVAGQLTKPLWIRPTGVVDLIGIRFRPTAVHTAWGISTHELNDRRVDLDDLQPRWSTRLRPIAHLAPGDRLDALHRTLGQLFDATPREASSWVTRAIDLLEHHRRDFRVSELTQVLGVTERRLQRAFRREVGVSPKMFARILRFQRAYRSLEEDPSRALAVALECGYFDQSHLIREFRQFADRSPTAADDAEALTRMFTVPYV